ncbi:MAG: hypothetical protein BGN84_16730 [Afipia sp. 62-7]|nr:hypothetical protein [Afipia sp.]OJU20239.1 MAG: hypothetical protein BGN84_16730 [Afipia sp. 62-7]
MIERKTNPSFMRTFVRRMVSAVLIIAVVTAGGLGLRAAALKHLGLFTQAPAVEFEIRLPQSAAKNDPRRDAQVELLTDQNQTLARLDETLLVTEDGRAVLRGQVPLKFRTSERMVVLSLPGQAQRAFKLRLPPNPGSSQEFGPWHMTDRVMPAGRALPHAGVPDDSYAIRYRVL